MRFYLPACRPGALAVFTEPVARELTTESGRGTTGQAEPRPLPPKMALLVPERLGYRLKNKLLGRPLTTETLASERLGRPTALAVLSSDVMSSSAYATEQILTVLVVAAGAAAFRLVLPITLGILVVLAVVTLSYREVIAAYPRAGGAYVVSRENFGPNVAQVAAASLLIDYTLTVAVSVAAGVDALASAFPILQGQGTRVALCVVLVLLLAYGNLRGIREAGRAFAVPTFLFIANMAIMIVVGIFRELAGKLHTIPLSHQPGAVPIGHATTGLFFGASLFMVLEAFANGGTALTGTEAISNGVSIFRQPQARNARKTLTTMALILGSMFLGVTLLASFLHPLPRISGTPTVLSQEAKAVYGSSGLGSVFYYALQFSTTAILALAANTSFTGFPFLASFAAQDSFLPRQLTRRGHRLVFSNGIVVLTAVAITLLVATRANVGSLISLYAIGVFTGFTMAGAGMVQYHRRNQGPRWRLRVWVNGSAAVLSALVDVIFIVTKFTHGAWVVVVLLPSMVFAFIRLHKRYEKEAAVLEEGAAQACEAPILRRHVVFVLVDRIDLATARAMQYGRTLTPDALRAVHFRIDPRQARAVQEGWYRIGLSRLPLDVIDCPDRRLTRAALELVASQLSDGDTEVSVLLPRRAYEGTLSRFMHDRSADRIAAVVSQLPHVNATVVPFQLTPSKIGVAGAGGEDVDAAMRLADADGIDLATDADGAGSFQSVPDTVPIAELSYRRRARVAGQITRVEIQPHGGIQILTATLEDGTGGVTLMWGRRKVDGVEPSARLVVEGMVGEYEGHLAIRNPAFEFLAPPSSEG